MNPEFRRNLWLEFSSHRLAAMPAVLALVFALAYLTGGMDALTYAGQAALVVFLLLWGSRLAADAVLGEVAAQTWDGQRLSAIGPWAMTWAKLLGSTSYAWYGALLALPAALLSIPQHGAATVLALLAAGILAQAVALLASLLFLQVQERRFRMDVTVCQTLGILAGLAGLTVSFDGTPDSWYGLDVSEIHFGLMTAFGWCIWAILGIWRQMRIELRFRGSPWVWLCFVLYLCGYYAGFAIAGDPAPGTPAPVLPGDLLVHGPSAVAMAPLLVAFGLALGVTYLAAYFEPKSVVALRRWGAALRAGDRHGAADGVPAWTVSAAVAALLAAVLVVAMPAGPSILIVAVLLFATRDIALLYLLTLDPTRRRGQMVVLLYLAVLYGLLPSLMAGLGAEAAMVLFWPVLPDRSMVGDGLSWTVAVTLVLAGPAVQAGLVVWLLRRRWRRLQAAAR